MILPLRASEDFSTTHKQTEIKGTT